MNLNMKLENIIYNSESKVELIKEIGEAFLIIPLSDFILVKCFGNNARWFQLYSFINFFIVYLMKDDIYYTIFY